MHCHHAFRPLLGFIDDVRLYASTPSNSWCDGLKLPDEDFVSLHNSCKKKLRHCIFSDMVLLYSPGILAAVALCLGLEDYKRETGSDAKKGDWSKVDIMQYFSNRFKGQKTPEEIAAFSKDLGAALEVGRHLGDKEGRKKYNCAMADDIDRVAVKGAYKRLKKVRKWGDAGVAAAQKRKAESGGGGGSDGISNDDNNVAAPNKRRKVEP